MFAKLENFNPSSSVKIRIAFKMLQNAEQKGLINSETHIVEPTSGNTGIGLAMVGAVKGYRVSLVMPENASVERRKIMKAYGAKLILTPASEGMKGAIAKAQELAAADSNVFIPNQFENPANVEAHAHGTALEIWQDLNGQINAFVSAVGTGGTITGIAKTFKHFNPKISIIALEPENSQVIAGKQAGSHKIQGMGAGFIPSILDKELIDYILPVSDQEAFLYARYLAKNEGIFVGISSGAALAGVVKFIKILETKLPNIDKTHKYNIITVFPDTGERYLSTELW